MVELGYQRAIACDATFGTNEKKILSHVHSTIPLQACYVIIGRPNMSQFVLS
jgi:hypothetical protein